MPQSGIFARWVYWCGGAVVQRDDFMGSGVAGDVLGCPPGVLFRRGATRESVHIEYLVSLILSAI